jgi:hypothetical protein
MDILAVGEKVTCRVARAKASAQETHYSVRRFAILATSYKESDCRIYVGKGVAPHTSSTMTWETAVSCGLDARRLSRMPVVQNSSRVARVLAASNRTWYLHFKWVQKLVKAAIIITFTHVFCLHQDSVCM